MKLSEITEKTTLVKDFANRLAKTTRQAIVNTTIEKTKRVSGASARAVSFALENSQTVKIYLRVAGEAFDIFRIDINGKMQKLAGDYSNDYAPSFNASVDIIANMVKQGQAAFDKRQAKKKVALPKSRSPRTAPKNKAQQRNALHDEIAVLDEKIAKRTATKNELQAQLDRLLTAKQGDAADD
ncbi:MULTISPECIES: hypothetical protein [unclassified Psychrobacter]|uniref:hypothetical protein n=1 Tax=unclassified Psychrobacter TaxID=196806 RepID=UPI0018F392E5|nr:MULTISPECIES: hypothetical protein [unclassified Psychrobacter]